MKLFIKLILLYALIKCIFYLWNLPVGKGWQIDGLANIIQIFYWSFFYDVLIVFTLVFIPALLLLFSKKITVSDKIISAVFASLLALGFLLNLADVFYYSFKLQRSDAETFFVLRNPFKQVNSTYFLLFIAAVLAYLAFAFISYRILLSYKKQQLHNPKKYSTVIFLFLIGLFFLMAGNKKWIPTYPIVKLPYYQLPLVQNSFHTFTYSIFRGNASLLFDANFLKEGPQQVNRLIKRNRLTQPKKRNLVLFIMESVPSDFFEANHKYKVPLPFLDSLITKSTYFKNCFSYSHHSNKGITAILSGTPTLTEIPLYHSAYTGIPMAHTGTLLKTQGYQSAFFVGDNYDDFGFAKCVSWLGFDKYYCQTDVPNYKQLPQHTMGLHDEFVLHFMQQKIAEMKPPFFAVNFNISTHVPNDLPPAYLKSHPAKLATKQMKSMQYYDDCLHKFFNEARNQPWFNETVFIFIADHWMYPNLQQPTDDVLQNFRIPLIVFDPQNNQPKNVETPTGQFDVLNTLLYFAHYQKPFISYGKNLMGLPQNQNRVIFAKENDIIYQAFDSSYVLGYNIAKNEVAYFYNYKTDILKQNNLKTQLQNPQLQRLTTELNKFLRTAYHQYQYKKIY